MISKKLLGLAALTAAGAMAPGALAAPSGTLASATFTVRHLRVDGLPATRTVNLAGDAVTQVATCSGQVRKTIVHGESAGRDIVSTASYDAAGLLLAVRDATGAGADYAYDALGRKTVETDAAIAGKVRRFAYDAAGRLASATDPLGVITTYGYDDRGRLVAESTPMNAGEVRLIRYGYDARGLRTTLTDANGAVTTWGYDESGRNVAKTYANGDHREMAYDAAGRLVRLTDENGRSITSVHDLAGRLVRKEFGSLASDPSPIASDIDTYAYDLASRLTSVTKGRYAHTLTYGYDQAGRLATETHPDGTVLHLAYDDANRLANLSLSPIASAQSPDYSVAYAYDARGLLATVSTGDYATRYEYRANGQLASTVDYRVIDPQADILRADRTYDAGARLTEVANTAANGEQSGVRYTLALDDQRTEAIEESGAKWQYGYDNIKQLVTAKKTDTQATVIPPLDQSYAYDPMGNRRTYADQTGSTAYAANSANQYTAVGGVASVYDRNGNLLTDGVKNYTWDAENQLTSVTPVNPTEGSAKVEYTYDWRMRRIGKKSYVYANGGWTLARTHDFKYHEWNLIQETITNNSQLSPVTSTKSYVWGNDLSGNLHGAGGVGGLLWMKATEPAASSNYAYAYDGNGNVRALVKADATNPAASGVVERYAYDGFGRELPSSTSVANRISPIAFSTKYLEAETAMNYYGYRYYAANVGRWINRDPIEEKGGINVYSQCENGLIVAFDVLGMKVRIVTSGSEYGKALNYLSNSATFKTIYDKLDNAPDELVITAMPLAASIVDTFFRHPATWVSSTLPGVSGGSFVEKQSGPASIYWDPRLGLLTGTYSKQGNKSAFCPTGKGISPAVILAHEMAHAYHYIIEKTYNANFSKVLPEPWHNQEEKSTIEGYEHIIASELNDHFKNADIKEDAARSNHKGALVKVDSSTEIPFGDYAEYKH